ncbi:S8 family peptidase [Rothia sp. RSM407]|uniref:S8 family peptidase n=1 Tax=Rothia sp. RSM407 TaxID=3398581 RepID=UPI00244C8E79|nr:S8 family serine peptidase [Rothia mucilaginosa]
MFHSERRRGMPLTGWSLVLFFACVSRVFGVCVSVGSDRGATRRIRKDAALGASAALTLLPLWIPLAPAAWATDPTPSASASPSPKREVTATPSPSGTAVLKTSATPSQGTSTKNGDDVRQREYWLNEYGITSLWSQATGKGVTVAVIDTGVDGTHPDLEGNVLRGYDASGVGSEDGWKGLGAEPMHGTEVASLIAGHGHDTQGYSAIAGQPGKPTGVIGVAPDAKILPISLNMGTTGGKSIDEQIPAAVRYAVDNGAQIINMSIGSNKTSWPQSWDEAFAYAEQKGVLIVAAAGNRGSGLTQVGAPATIPGVLTVGGIDRNKQVSEGSSTQGISIAVVAPSTDMIAAAPGNGYMIWSGSSAAAPLVTGVAALLKQKYPKESAAQLAQRLIASADDAGATGRDPLYGYGIFNPQDAMALASPAVTANPLGSISEWIAVHRKQQVSVPTPNDAAPVHEEGESIVKAAAPDARRPPEDRGWLPPVILAALVLWLTIITAGSVHRLHRMHVSAGQVAQMARAAAHHQGSHRGTRRGTRRVSKKS